MQRKNLYPVDYVRLSLLRVPWSFKCLIKSILQFRDALCFPLHYPGLSGYRWSRFRFVLRCFSGLFLAILLAFLSVLLFGVLLVLRCGSRRPF